jgi:dihydroorotate dehydrogenase
MSPSLATTVAGVPLGCCVYNASGPKSGHVSDLVNVGSSAAGAVLSKSATLVKQTVVQGPVITSQGLIFFLCLKLVDINTFEEARFKKQV